MFSGTSSQIKIKLMTKLILFVRGRIAFPHTYFKLIIFISLLFLTGLSASAQSNVKITGRVIDDQSNQPIIGVPVVIKGTTVGVATDQDGKFELQTSQALPITLIINNIGYKYQEVDIYELEPLTIRLSENSNKLNEVVVIGYGTKKREEITGSIASISASQIKEANQASFVSGLQGLASGVQVTQTSGAPGGAASVRIRGGNSINGGNEPLYVIDGFPIYNDNSIANAGALSSGTNINPLSSISPNDIESIDVLKDASATSIYGSRGANGVIIITTKKGKSNVGSINYDASFGFQEVSHKIALLNAKEWGTYKNDALINNGKSALYSEAQLDSLGNNSTDWQAAVLRKAQVQSHQLSFIGGNEKTKYAVSFGTLDQQGIIIGSDFKRYNARVNLTSKVNDRLSLGVNVNETYSKANVSPDGTLTAALYMPPTVPVRDEDGNYTFKSPYESAVANPVATLNEITNISKINRFLGSGYAEYKLIEGLTAKVLIGVDLLDNKQNNYIPSTLYEGSTVKGSASVGSKFTTNILNENTLTYTKTFNKVHNLELLGGFTQQKSETEGSVASAQGFTNDDVTFNNLGSGATLVKSTSSYVNWALNSYLGRATYGYNSKYFFTASFRADGSSRLGKNNRWGYFPSASFAWQVSNEPFLKSISNLNWISNLKIRFSAGKTGNQEISPYQSLSLLTAYSYPTASGTTTITGYASSQVSNPDLKWETTTQYDGGVDIGILKDRISLIVDAYYKKTTDLLLAVPLPVSSGYSTSMQNIGSVENKGLEFTLNTLNFSGKFNWNTSVTFSLNRNKVLALNEGVEKILVSGEIQTGNAIVVGQPLGSFWGYKTNGLYRSTDEIPATPLLANTKVGDVNYVDVNKDTQITQAGDQTIIGNAQPKFIYGFTNNFAFKNFDLSVFLQGSYGNKVYSYIIQQLMVPTGYQNVIAGFSDHYTADNTDAKYQRPNELITTNAVSDLYVFDASYLKVKSVTFGYELPKNLTSKIKVAKIRLYVSAQNLLTLTKYPGYDPEVNYYDSNSSRQGVDAGSYPSAKTYSAGISLTF
jgi:TonB-dependent starch-binding outer membrane protein SusC